MGAAERGEARFLGWRVPCLDRFMTPRWLLACLCLAGIVQVRISHYCTASRIWQQHKRPKTVAKYNNRMFLVFFSVRGSILMI